MRFCKHILLDVKTIAAQLLCAHLTQKIITRMSLRGKRGKEGQKDSPYRNEHTQKKGFTFHVEIFTYSPEEELL